MKRTIKTKFILIKKFPRFILMFVLATFSSCITDNVNIRMGYLETQCADPWHDDFGTEITDIKEFFNERDVDARSIKRNKYVVEAEQLAVCTSKVGSEIEVMVNPDDTFFLRTIEFYIK